MRLPNSFGSVYKLSGKRRNPYIAIKTLGYELVDGKAKRKTQTVGYFKTKSEALQKLSEFNSKPYSTDTTFKEVYERWSAEKYETLSQQSITNYVLSYKYLESLHDKTFVKLKTVDLENAIQNTGKSDTLKSMMKKLLNQMYKYALKYDIASIDYSSRFTIEMPKTKIVRKVYTEEEITQLWANKDDEIIATTLVQIYSGMRIAEVLTCEVDKKENVFRGGVKTKAGKDRIIPIHNDIMELVDNISRYPKQSFLYHFGKAMKRLSMNHTTHDARVTFASKADGAINETSLKLIMGHHIPDLTKRVYTKKSIEELRAEINKLDFVSNK